MPYNVVKQQFDSLIIVPLDAKNGSVAFIFNALNRITIANSTRVKSMKTAKNFINKTLLACAISSGLMLLTISPLQAKSVAEKGISFEHQDWEIACDNTGTCRAAGYQAEGDGLPLSVLLTRKAGASQAVHAELKLGTTDYVENQPTPQSVSMWINGKNYGSVDLANEALNGDLNQRQISALTQELAGNARIEFKSGKKVWRLSDSGATAVLLKMDALQGRVGTTGALIKKGKNSEADVFKPRPVPVVTWVKPNEKINKSPAMQRLIKSVDLNQLKKDLIKHQLVIKQRHEKNGTDVYADECTVLNGEDQYAKFELEVEPLNDNKLLASGLCWRGAYNSGVGYWLIDAKKPYQPQLVTTGASDYSEGIINANQKGRGLGDCWSNDEWTWNGTEFIQSHAATTGMCKMVEAGGAWDLPTKVARVIEPSRIKE